MRTAWAFTLVLSGAIASPLGAKDHPQKASASLVDAVVRCQTIANDAERLHCFDTATKALNDALAAQNVYVFDKADVEKTQRDSFGLPPPDFFKPSKNAPEIPFNLTTTVTSAVHQGDGNWVIVLAEGGTWVQTDAAPLGRSPRPGMAVVVNKATLGGFKMTVAGQSAGRVRRIR